MGKCKHHWGRGQLRLRENILGIGNSSLYEPPLGGYFVDGSLDLEHRMVT